MVPRSVSIVLPDPRGGGAERVAVNLANGFARRRFEDEMVLLSTTGTFLADLQPDIRAVDVQARCLPAGRAVAFCEPSETAAAGCSAGIHVAACRDLTVRAKSGTLGNQGRSGGAHYVVKR